MWYDPVDALLGTWLGEEEVLPTAWTSGGPAVGRLTIVRTAAGLTLDYVESADGRPDLVAHGVVAGDGWWWFDSYGFVPTTPGTAEWKGDSLVLERSSERGRTVLRLRRVGDELELASDTAGPGDAVLQPLVRGRYRRDQGADEPI